MQQVTGHVPVIMMADDRPDLTPSALGEVDVGVAWGAPSNFEYDQNLNGQIGTNQPTGSSAGNPESEQPPKFREETRIESVPSGVQTFYLRSYNFSLPVNFRTEDRLYSEMDCIQACNDEVALCEEVCNDNLAEDGCFPCFLNCQSACDDEVDACLEACSPTLEEENIVDNSGDDSFRRDDFDFLGLEEIELGSETYQDFVGAHPDGSPITQAVELTKTMTLVYRGGS